MRIEGVDTFAMLIRYSQRSSSSVGLRGKFLSTFHWIWVRDSPEGKSSAPFLVLELFCKISPRGKVHDDEKSSGVSFNKRFVIANDVFVLHLAHYGTLRSPVM